jgi:hypothetical protein
MNEIDQSTMIRLQDSTFYYYSVKDTAIDSGGDGVTIAYCEKDDYNDNEKFKMVQHMCFSTEMGIEIAKAILKLTTDK